MVNVISMFKEQNEFMTSLLVFWNKSLFKKTDLTSKWQNNIQEKMSDRMIDSLAQENLTSKLEILHNFSLLDLGTGETVEDLCHWVKNYSVSQLTPEVISFYGQKLPQDMDGVLPILETWNTIYFSKLDSTLLENLHSKQAEVAQLLTYHHPLEVVEEATNGLHLEGFGEDLTIYLVPQFHVRPIVLFHVSKTVHIYSYAADNISAEPGALPPEMLRTQQALSDENRLKMLQLIATGPKAFKTIHQYMGIAKSTVHHHLITLRAAGLVRIHVHPDKADRYSFRKEALRNLESKILSYVYSSEKR
ncbi:ArsR/SmtB family transcription factor [Evansella tamaricis]|uniref:Winged helix-turn-helix domain-containing protein n=1 Tax=Evansella tamaricis TaxID=2069301 RepID=A0ABS6JBY6_9BACI|nr:winged helix-turn-helix domain-containing protein [Evansella tamaricis]MBU9710940.1 winged helix-turn-helix domain-containing protein [Evansella tamaricis]